MLQFLVQFEGVSETFQFLGTSTQEAVTAAMPWLAQQDPMWGATPNRMMRVLMDFDAAFPGTHDSPPRRDPRWLASNYKWTGSEFKYVNTERL